MVVNDPPLIVASGNDKGVSGGERDKEPTRLRARELVKAHEDYGTVRQNRYGRAAHLHLRPVFGWGAEVRAQSVVSRGQSGISVPWRVASGA